MIRFERDVVLFVALFIISVVGCGEESEQILQPERHPEMSENSVLATGADDVSAAPALAASWHGLSQSQRNQKIIQTAEKDLGKNLGVPNGRCKTWVQAVVYRASNHAVYPPKTDMIHKDRWIDDPENTDSEYCIGHCAPITSARPGEIVQVRWKANMNPPDNLHTFIVVSVNASTLTVIDSNGKNKTTVRQRELLISEFDGSDDAKADSFSIYYIR